MTYPALAVGLVLLAGAGVWAAASGRARRRVLSEALGAGDPRRRLAALVILDDTGIRGWVGQLGERAVQEVDPWVADALAGVVAHRLTGRLHSVAAADLAAWAKLRSDADPGPLPPDPEVEVIVAALQADLAVAARRGRPPLGPGLFALVALILAVQVVAPPFKGMGNNGDFPRVMDAIHVGYGNGETAPVPAAYVQREFRTGVSHDTVSYQTSQVPLVKLAAAVGGLAGGDGSFDLRWLGVVNLGVFLLGLWAVLRATARFDRPARVVVSILAVVAFADAGYYLYFNSFYSEPAMLSFALATMGSAAAVGLSSRPWVPYLAFVTAAVLLVTSKSQAAILALPLAALGAVLVVRRLRGVGRLAGAALVVVVLAAGSFSLSQSDTYVGRVNVYNAVFDGVLPSSSSPEAALRDLGLAPDLIRYNHTRAFSPDGGFATADSEERIFNRVALADVAKFYAGHPSTLLSLLQDTATHAFELRPPDIGTLERSQSEYRQEYGHADPWTAFHRWVLPHQLWFVVAILGLALVVAGHGMRRAQRRASPRAAPEVLAALAVMAAMAFVVAPIGEGRNEIVKHEFLFNVLFDLCLITLIGTLVPAAHRLFGRIGNRLAVGSHPPDDTVDADPAPRPVPASIGQLLP